MDAQRLEVVLAHRYESHLALDVGDVLHAEERQLFGRHMSNSFALVHRILSTAPAARSWVSASAPLAERWEPPVISPPVISIVRTRLSTSGRTRSMWRRPLSNRAPLTSMPSARTKERWNWRAAMPRCR